MKTQRARPQQHYLKKFVDDFSAWQARRNWPETGNVISCLSRKSNSPWWKKCTRHWACTHVHKRRLFRQRQLSHMGLGEGDYGTRSHTAEPYSCLQVWVWVWGNRRKENSFLMWAIKTTLGSEHVLLRQTETQFWRSEGDQDMGLRGLKFKNKCIKQSFIIANQSTSKVK